MLYSIKIVLPQFFLIVRRARPKSAKRPTFHWANLSGIKLDRINKATALYHSRGINHQNRVRVCRYSYWLFWKISVKFDVQKYSDMCYDEGHCGRSILKNANPPHSFYVWCLESLRAEFQGNPSNSHTLLIRSKKAHSHKTEVAFFRSSRFVSIWHHLLRHMSTLWIPSLPTANRNVRDPPRLLVRFAFRGNSFQRVTKL